MARPQSPSVPSVSGRAPRLARGGQDAQAPKLPPMPPFWLVAHPDRWCVIEGRVVPLLHEFKLEHGVNGVIVHKDPATGELVIDSDGAEANLRSKGAKPIPWDVDGEGTCYIVEVAPERWLLRFQHAIEGSSQTLTDQVAYVEWLVDLQERAVLPRPQLHNLERLEATLRFDLEHSRKAQDSHRANLLEEQLDAIAREKPEALARHQAELARRRKRGLAPAPAAPPRMGVSPDRLRASEVRLEKLPDEVRSQGGSVGELDADDDQRAEAPPEPPSAPADEDDKPRRARRPRVAPPKEAGE